nr:MAG TPA: hypothetical protein [Caudoviricetes sp.]
MASIIKFVLDKAGGPAPYYWNVPQNFSVPAAYFPTPEIDTGGETFLTYFMDYVWYIKLFHATAQGAYSLGHPVISAIRAARNLIPLIAEDGSEIDGSWVRVNDPQLKVLDDGAAQLTISWRSRRPYSDTTADREQAHTFHVDVFMQSGKTVSDAYAEALEQYAIPVNQSGGQPE